MGVTVGIGEHDGMEENHVQEGDYVRPKAFCTGEADPPRAITKAAVNKCQLRKKRLYIFKRLQRNRLCALQQSHTQLHTQPQMTDACWQYGTSIFSKLHALILWKAACQVRLCPAPTLRARAAAPRATGGTTENRGSPGQMWVSGETWATSPSCPDLDQDLPLGQFWFTRSKSKHVSAPLKFAKF